MRRLGVLSLAVALWVASGLGLSASYLKGGTTTDLSAGTAALPTGDMTLVIWGKITCTIGTTAVHWYDNRTAANTDRVMLAWIGPDSAFYGGWYTAGVDYRAGSDDIDPTQDVWFNLILTINDATNTTTLYRDNNVGNGANASLVTHTTADTWLIGNNRYEESTADCFRVAEFAVIDKVISSGERTDLQTKCASDAVTSNIVYYAKLNTNLTATTGTPNVTNDGFTQDSDHPSLTCGGATVPRPLLLLGVG